MKWLHLFPKCILKIEMPSQSDSTFIHVTDAMACHPGIHFIADTFILPGVGLLLAHIWVFHRKWFWQKADTYSKVMVPPGKAATSSVWSIVGTQRSGAVAFILPLELQSTHETDAAPRATIPQPTFPFNPFLFPSPNPPTPPKLKPIPEYTPISLLHKNLSSLAFPGELDHFKKYVRFSLALGNLTEFFS